MKFQKTVQMAEIALMSAVLCILAPFAIPLPFSPVPVTLGTFVVYLSAVLLGPKKGTISVLVYLLIGMAGLPVFSGFGSGLAKLAGPTGGYAIGYVPCAFLIGWLVERGVKTGQSRKNSAETMNSHAYVSRKKNSKDTRQWQQIFQNACSMILGTVVCYLFGTVWFLILMEGTYTLTQALLVCVVPYLPFDVVKIALASVIAVPVKKMLRQAGVMQQKGFR